MASRKKNRSSKTNHVLSLLSGGEEERPAGTPTAAEAPSAPADPAVLSPAPPAVPAAPVQPVVPAHPAAPILEVARASSETLSHTIRDALNQSLEEELARQARQQEENASAALQEEPAPQEILPEEAEPPVPDLEPAPEPEPAPAPEPQPAPNIEPSPVPEVPFAPRETRLPDGSVCLNVMELLVDERLERYVKMFGLCNCSRCLADARALALTRLPAKYVVLSASAATPMTSLYRARYENQVVAQVIQACKTVMESPRHPSEEPK